MEQKKKGVTLWNFPLDSGDVQKVSADQTWADIVEQELGNRNLTEQRTVRNRSFGPYVIQWDDASLMRHVPVNRAWSLLFKYDNVPHFHGAIVMFHSDEFETDWKRFQQLVVAAFEEEYSTAKVVQIKDESD